jgi:hypothetical protein
MKPKLFASMVFFYGALLLTMFVMPMLVTAQGGYDRAAAQSWDRHLDIPVRARSHADVRQLRTETPVLSPAAKRVPVGKSFPDAGMINTPANKLRATALKG